MAQTSYQALIDAQVKAVMGAGGGSTPATRTGLWNGSEPRLLSTPAGDLESAIPKLPSGVVLPSPLERRWRVGQALFAVIMGGPSACACAVEKAGHLGVRTFLTHLAHVAGLADRAARAIVAFQCLELVRMRGTCGRCTPNMGPAHRSKAVRDMTETVGSISSLWRFPVKSMAGEQLLEAALTSRGLLGDRAYALIDVETGKVVSAKSAKRFPDILSCRAAFLETPEVGADTPPVRITFPDGGSTTSDAPDCDDVLTRLFGRKVRLSSVAPEDFTIDQYHPDVPEADPAGHRDTVVDVKLGSAFFAEIGAPSPVPIGAFFDLFPVSVITTSTLDCLQHLKPESRFEARRFRMNLVVATEGDGFVENRWIGHSIALGDGPRVQVAMPDPRCVMPTLAQDDLPRDNDILRTLVRHNRLEIEPGARFPCAGVYGVVEEAGTLRPGDRVAVS